MTLCLTSDALQQRNRDRTHCFEYIYGNLSPCQETKMFLVIYMLGLKDLIFEIFTCSLRNAMTIFWSVRTGEWPSNVPLLCRALFSLLKMNNHFELWTALQWINNRILMVNPEQWCWKELSNCSIIQDKKESIQYLTTVLMNHVINDLINHMMIHEMLWRTH